MAIKMIPIAPENKYGNYFLATEAPGDPPKSNVRVVSVPQNNRGKDFTSGYDTTDDDLVDDNEPDTTETEPAANEPIPDDQDFTADTDTTDIPADGGEDEIPPPETSATDAGADPTTGQDAPEGDADTAVDDTAGADDATDFTAGAEGEDPDDPNAVPPEGADPNNASPPTEGQSTQNDSVGTDQDSTRTYKLYLEYTSLYNSVNNYVSKLEKVVRDEPADNKIVNYCTRKFRDIRTIIFDYVTVKYTQNNYIQNLLFYEKLVAMTQLVLKVLAHLGKTTQTKK